MPLAVGFGAAVIGGTILEILSGGVDEVGLLHAKYEVGASAEERVEVATRVRFDHVACGSVLHRAYWEVGHQIVNKLL